MPNTQRKLVAAAMFAVLTADIAMAGNSLPVCNESLGTQVIALCSACHALHPGEAPREGPNLSGVFGSVAGTNDRIFKYSPALVASKWLWEAATIDRFLTNPRRALPGTTMTFIGLKAPDEREAVTCYLQQLSLRDAMPP